MTKRLYIPLVAAALIAMLPGNRAVAYPPITDPGRSPYQFFANLQPCVHTTCQATTPAVPEGKRHVVQQVSAFGALTSPGNTVEVGVSTPTAVLSTFAPPVFGTTNQGFAFDQPVLGFADAGQTVTVFIDQRQLRPGRVGFCRYRLSARLQGEPVRPDRALA